MAVNVGAQFQGCSFRLHPKNRLLLQERFGQTIDSASVFVSNEAEEPFAIAYQSKWLPICSLLSGLSNEQLHSLDEIVFQEPFPVKELLTISPSSDSLPVYDQAS